MIYFRILFTFLLVFLSSCFTFSVFAEGECRLSDTSASPLQAWRENINLLNTALRTKAEKVSCTQGSDTAIVNSDFAKYATKIIPLDSSIGLMREVQSLSSNGADFFSEVDAFMDPAGPVQELKPHLASIEEIERSIIETAQFVGSHCAQSFEIEIDVLEGKSGYDTRGRSMSHILVDMAQQTKEVKRFFQILSQGIHTEEYVDEVPFLIASAGFSRDMYMYYSPKYIQECRDNDPRKGAIMDVLKGAFTSGWKYPQAIQVWKDAMALMLYRGSSLFGGPTDVAKESQINAIVQAQKGGLGNSDIMINSQFFKELGYRPNSQSIDEKIEMFNKQVFYGTMGYDFIRKVVPNIFSLNGTNDTGFVKNGQLQEVSQDIVQLQNLEESFYGHYSNRRRSIVENNKANDPQLITDLAQTVQGFKGHQQKLQESEKGICSLLGKQATNISGAWRC